MKKALVLLLAYTVFISGCSSNKESKGAPDKFQVTTPLVLDTTYTMDYVAEIRSVSFVELRARVKGYIEKINTDEGKEVRKGQLLFQISNEDYREQLLKSRANLKNLQAELKAQQLELANLNRLVDKNVVSKTQVEIGETKEDALKAKVEEAQANVTEMEINLSRTEIKAPFDGVIDLIPNKVGSLIDEGTLLSSLTSNESVFAYFNVSEQDYLDFFSKIKLEDNQKVSLIMANNAIHNAPGVIETITGKIDNSTGNLTMRAKFPNPERIIKHGSSCKVRIYLPLKNAILIPQRSAMEIQDKNYVFTVDKDNIVRLKAFKPKFRLPEYYVVESGLDSNDKIIYEGVQYLKDGDKIIPEETHGKKNSN